MRLLNKIAPTMAWVAVLAVLVLMLPFLAVVCLAQLALEWLEGPVEYPNIWAKPYPHDHEGRPR